MSNSSKYLRFIELLSEINKKYDLTSREISLLNFVFIGSSNNQRLRVKDLLCLSQIGSQATIHSALQRLIQKNLLRAVSSKDDGRNKFIEITSLAQSRYSQIERAIAKTTA